MERDKTVSNTGSGDLGVDVMFLLTSAPGAGPWPSSGWCRSRPGTPCWRCSAQMEAGRCGRRWRSWAESDPAIPSSPMATRRRSFRGRDPRRRPLRSFRPLTIWACPSCRGCWIHRPPPPSVRPRRASSGAPRLLASGSWGSAAPPDERLREPPRDRTRAWRATCDCSVGGTWAKL